MNRASVELWLVVLLHYQAITILMDMTITRKEDLPRSAMPVNITVTASRQDTTQDCSPSLDRNAPPQHHAYIHPPDTDPDRINNSRPELLRHRRRIRQYS